MKPNRRFANYPAAVAYRKPKSRAIGNAAQHLIWGDWIKLTGNREGTWCEAYVRGVRGEVWIQESDIQENRLLEINFVDIGQGDGCLIITPDDKRIVVDAGEKDNMLRFLRWRFGGFNKKRRFESFIVTHPDSDHYRGFSGLLKQKNVLVESLFHNGILERTGRERLGPTRTVGGIRYLEDVILDRTALERFLDSQTESRQPYTNILRQAVTGGRVGDIRMLSARDQYLPGYGREQKLAVQVLSPVPERGWKLRWFGSPGKTKNGHSIVLRLLYGHLSILLGGDLNIPAENYLLNHYTGIDPEKASARELQDLLRAARLIFECDVAKACHHGSSDFSTNFFRAVNPIATVVSSGDNEPYAHPRPDALGSFGRYGRGARPLIFSTELARSGREIVKEPYKLRGQIQRHMNDMLLADKSGDREIAKGKLSKLIDPLTQRSVATYGMISLRTDGERVVIAQRLERKRNNASKWDIHCLETGPYGLTYQSKYVTGGKRMRDISKGLFLDGLNCTTRAWYARRLPGGRPTESDRFRLEQGLDVGNRAKELYPEGIEVQSRQLDRAASVTRRLIADRQVKTLFESAFRDGTYVTRADILVRIPGGWKLIEVKSSKPPGVKQKSKLAELIDDISYTASVAINTGVPIKKMSLLLISPRYRRSMPVDKMFIERDVTSQVKERLAEFKILWADLATATEQKKRPRPIFNRACKGCDYFSNRCLGLDVKHPVTELPAITRSPRKMAALGNLRRPSIELIPADLKLTEAQSRVREAVLKGGPIHSEALGSRLAVIEWPAYYLDFETMATAIPLYPDTAPWEQIVTQYSIHKFSKLGQEERHSAYLADFDRDCRLELLKRLLRDLGTSGHIIVYSNFEKLRINDLKKRFPRYAARLDALVKRLFDLHEVLKGNYYHPEFHGSTSIKKVLPALIPRMSYKSLAIQNGDEAVTIFARAAKGQYTEKQKEQARQNLLSYCKQDTWAMAKLHERLANIA